MSDIELKSVPLDVAQNAAIKQSETWTAEARAAVGDAYLRLQYLRQEVELAEQELAAAATRGRQQEAQHARVLATLGEVLKLPSGEWVYDASNACLVRKDLPHA